MTEKTEDIMAKIVNLCESNPDAGLEFIEQTIRDKPESESDPFGKFAKAMAYGSKGLFQLSRSKPDVDYAAFDQEDLRDDLGVTDTHLDHLEKGLQEIREMEEIHPGALTLFGTEEDRMGELKVDAMATVLERCRPGRVQQILGKTKLKYFGPPRVLSIDKGILVDVSEELSPEDFRVFGDIFFVLHSTVRTAVVSGPYTDSRGRKYVQCALYKRIPDSPLPTLALHPAAWKTSSRYFLDMVLSRTIGEAWKFEGRIYLFDDGSFADELPEERKEEKREAKEEKSNRTEQPKKKGLFGKLFG